MRSKWWIVALVSLTSMAAVWWLIPQPQEQQLYPGLTVGTFGLEEDLARHVGLDPRIQLTPGSPAEVMVFADGSASRKEAARAAGAVKAGASLVILAGSSRSDGLWAALGLPNPGPSRKKALTSRVLPVSDGAAARVNWSSAPQVDSSVLITSAALRSAGGTPLIVAKEDGSVLLGRLPLGRGTVFLFTPVITSGSNEQIRLWAYYNYFLYALIRSAAGQPFESFADWKYAPVPQPFLRRLLFAISALLWVATVAAFILIRRASKGRQAALIRFFPTGYRQKPGEDRWESINFTRPLSGFLFAVTVGFLYYVPSIILLNMVFPKFILPYPQAIGSWQWIKQVMGLVWLVFDMGTDLALIKFYAQYRVKEPARAVQYIQLFVWWQCLSGLIQLTGIPVFAANVLVHSNYAYLSIFFALSALTQFPGFLGMHVFVFRALQRFDLEQLLTMVGMVTIIPLQFLLVYACRRWGAAHLAYGPAIGGVMGYGFSQFANTVLLFFLGCWLLKRLGFHQKWLFMANFEWKEAARALSFGFKAAIGSIAVALAYSLQMFIISEQMLNYTELTGMFQMAMDYTVAIGVVLLLYYELMPAISEAFSHGKTQLTRYYVAQGWKYGAMFSFAIGGSLLAIVDRYISGTLGAQWSRAAALATPLMIWGLLQFPAWLGDQVQLGAGRPGLQSILMVAEQTLRIVLVFLLVPRFQIWGLIYAYIPALVLKGLAAMLVNHKLIVRLYMNLWQGIIAPLLALGINYALLRAAVLALWRPEPGISNLLFFGCLVAGQLTYFFFTGILGGWDEDSLAEFGGVGAYSGFARPLARLYLVFIRAGAALSPLHNKFKTTIYHEAMAEADALTAEKVRPEEGEVSQDGSAVVGSAAHPLGS